MHILAPGISYGDLRFHGVPEVIATVLLQSAEGVTLIDPGPSSCLGRLRELLATRGATVADIRSILLTHIHLDHSGATGSLVKEQPQIKVFVHEQGARHLVDPARLLASAKRLYGDDMERLWGEFVPLPAGNINPVVGTEQLTVGDRTLQVAYTPGHASHHVSYFDVGSRLAFVGDVAGIRLRPGAYVYPPTPPPDIDLEAWGDSIERLQGWGAQTIFVTHFGPWDDVANHVSELLDHLRTFGEIARGSLTIEAADEIRARNFAEKVRQELRREMAEADVERYEAMGPMALGWLGLARYWRRARR